MGHFSNDIVGGLCFNYQGYYLTYVCQLSPYIGGLTVLVGQFTDAFFTPIAGVLSDKTNCSCGKRKGWYIFGSIVCTPAFFFIFF